MSNLEFYLALGIAALAVACALLVVAGRRGERVLLILACLSGALVFPSDYWLGVRPVFHQWDQYHLFMAARYFPQLGYQDFYRCAQAADQENEPARWQSPHLVRDSASNLLVGTNAASTNCAGVLGTERWPEFKADIAYFAGRIEELKAGRWLATFTDYGVNVTPFWAGLYHPLTARLAAGPVVTSILAGVDLAFLLAALALIYVGWGPVRFSFALLFISINETSRPGWIVGSVFRLEWLFLLVLGAFALKRGRPRLALLAAALGNLLRPVAVLAPLAAWVAIRPRRKLYGALAGCLGLALALLLASGRAIHGLGEYSDNALKYQNSFLTNSVGLLPLWVAPSSRQLNARQFARAGGELEQRQLSEKLYRAIVIENQDATRVGYVLCVVLLLGLAAAALTVLEPLSAYIFNAAISFVLTTPPAYYSLILILLFLLPELPVAFTMVAFLVMAVAKLVPLYWGQTAEAYALQSYPLVTMVVVLLSWYLWRGRWRWRKGRV